MSYFWLKHWDFGHLGVAHSAGPNRWRMGCCRMSRWCRGAKRSVVAASHRQLQKAALSSATTARRSRPRRCWGSGASPRSTGAGGCPTRQRPTEHEQHQGIRVSRSPVAEANSDFHLALRDRAACDGGVRRTLPGWRNAQVARAMCPFDPVSAVSEWQLKLLNSRSLLVAGGYNMDNMAASPRQRKKAATCSELEVPRPRRGAAGVGVSTIKRWLADPQFRAMVSSSPDIRLGLPPKVGQSTDVPDSRGDMRSQMWVSSRES